VFLFSEELRFIVATTHSGTSTQVVAPWGVGATTLLQAAVAQLRHEDYAVISVSGAPYARHIEYLGLHQVLGGSAESLGERSFLPLLERSVELLQRRPMNAIVIDTVEDVDRGTLTVLQAAAERTGAPIVVSRSRDLRSLIAGGSPFTRFRGPRVDLKPLDFVSTASLLHRHLGQWPDAEVTSRAFAKSSGITGLAVAIVTGAKQGGLVRLVDDRWVMAATSLLSGEADSWIESHLAMLSPEEYDMLERIAITPTTVHAWSHAPADDGALKTLGALGLISVTPGEGGGTVVVQVPVMADYLRRLRGSQAARSIGGLGPPGAATEADDPVLNAKPGDLAPAVAAFRVSLERRILERAAQWSAARDVSSAITYLEALMDLPRTERAIREVFDQTPLSTARSASEAFDFVYLGRLWGGTTGRNDSRELGYADVAGAFPDWSKTIAGFEALLGGSAPAVPADEDGWTSSAESDLLAAAHSYSHLLAGDLVHARTWVRRLPAGGQLVTRKLRAFVESIVAFTDRDYVAALAESRDRVEAARCALDHNGILLHSYASALSLVVLARWAEARDVITAAVAYGPPASVDGVLYRALLFLGAFVDLGSGKASLAERLVAEAERIDVGDLRLPGMQRDLSRVLRQLLDGSPGSAMRTLRGIAESSTQAGGRFAAEVTLGLGLVVWPEKETLDQLADLYPERADLVELYDIVGTSFTRLDAAATAAGTVQDVTFAAFLARVLAARVRQETDRGDLVDDSVVAALRLVDARLPESMVADGWPLLDPPPPHSTGLTAREIQVALLVRTYSNAAVAARLGVSVRTIENHVHSAMKKTDSATRKILYERVALGARQEET
jgi:DNA-binding CsgD family transcriptional regulator